MGNEKPNRPPAWSNEERNRLDELLAERVFEAKLRAKRKAQIDAAKAWATWFISMAAAFSLLKEWVVDLWKQLITWLH